jgi:hypothetical protein
MEHSMKEDSWGIPGLDRSVSIGPGKTLVIYEPSVFGRFKGDDLHQLIAKAFLRRAGLPSTTPNKRTKEAQG